MSDLMLRGAGKAGAAAIDSPDDIAGLEVWFKADSLSLNNNDPVASWEDSSGKGHTATQATDDNKPTYKTNEQNGKPGVLFGPIVPHDYMGIATPATLAAWTAFAVFKSTQNPAIDTGAILGDNDSAGTAIGLGSSGIEYNGAYASVAANDVTGPFTVTAAAAFLIAVTKTGTTAVLYKNGADVTSDGTTDSASVDVGQLGARNGGVNNLISVTLMEVILYDTVLSTADRQAVESYLNTKYAIY